MTRKITPATDTPTPATEAPVEPTVAETTTPTKAPAPATWATLSMDATSPEAVTASAATIVEAYLAASTGDKTKIRNVITSGMTQAVKAMDLTTAQAWSAASDAVATAVTKPTEKVDANRVVADRIIALRYAAHRLTMGDVRPDGIDEADLDIDMINAMVTEWADQGDPDAVTNEVATAGDKIAKTKITRTAVRGSVEAHIETAFAELPVGTKLTVAQIRTRSGAASDGAIAARVWPRPKADGTVVESSLDFTAMGVRPTLIDGVRGLEKVS